MHASSTSKKIISIFLESENMNFVERYSIQVPLNLGATT
jgi:hypothetical protein